MLSQPLIGVHRRQTLLFITSVFVGLQLFRAGPTTILKIIRFPREGVTVSLNLTKRAPTITVAMIESLNGQAAGNLVGNFLVCERADAIRIVISSFRLYAVQNLPHGIKRILILNTTILAVLQNLGFCKLPLRNLGV